LNGEDSLAFYPLVFQATFAPQGSLCEQTSDLKGRGTAEFCHSRGSHDLLLMDRACATQQQIS